MRIFRGICVLVLLIAGLAVLAENLSRILAQTLVVVGNCRAQCFLSQHGAVHLYRRQTVQSLSNGLVGQLEGFLKALALYHLGSHRAGSDCRAAAEGLELNVLDDAVIRHLEVNLHNIAALSVADLADTVCVLNLADIARMRKVIEYLFTVLHKIYLLFVQSNKILVKAVV